MAPACMAASQIALVQLIPLGNRPARLVAVGAATEPRLPVLGTSWLTEVASEDGIVVPSGVEVVITVSLEGPKESQRSGEDYSVWFG